VSGLSTTELLELIAAACFLTAVSTWAGTAWWMHRRWEAEVAAEWADAMRDDEPQPVPLATGGVVDTDRLYVVGKAHPELAEVVRLPARFQHGRPDLRAGLHHGERCD